MSFPIVKVSKDFSFEAAHFLEGYEGACRNLHGHSYKLRVSVSGKIEPLSDDINDLMVIDFKELSRIVKKLIIEPCDHTCLNEVLPCVPTAEAMVVYFFKLIRYSLPKDVKLNCVTLWETETSFAEYQGQLLGED